MTALTLRQRVLDLLRATPNGIATLHLGTRLGIERKALAGALRDLCRRGLLRGTAGTTPGSVWTAVANPPRPVVPASSWRGGAAELKRARARSAAIVQGRPQR